MPFTVYRFHHVFFNDEEKSLIKYLLSNKNNTITYVKVQLNKFYYWYFKWNNHNSLTRQPQWDKGEEQIILTIIFFFLFNL